MAHDVYSSRDISLNWAGVPIDGFAPDSFVTVTRNEDFTDEEVGADGKLQISKNPNQTASITVVLQQNSSGNNALSHVITAQDAAGKLFTGSLLVNDKSSGKVFELASAHLKTSAEFGYGSTATGSNRSWTFFAEKMTYLELSVDDDQAGVIGTVKSVLDNL